MLILLSLIFLTIILNVVVRRLDTPVYYSEIENKTRYERASYSGQMIIYDKNTEFEPECIGDLPSGAKLWEIRKR